MDAFKLLINRRIITERRVIVENAILIASSLEKAPEIERSKGMHNSAQDAVHASPVAASSISNKQNIA